MIKFKGFRWEGSNFEKHSRDKNYLILRSQKLKNEKIFTGNILQDKYWHVVEMFVGLDQPCEGQFLRWNIIFKWITTFSVTSWVTDEICRAFSVTSWDKGQILRSFRDMLRRGRNLSSFFRDTLRPVRIYHCFFMNLKEILNKLARAARKIFKYIISYLKIDQWSISK